MSKLKKPPDIYNIQQNAVENPDKGNFSTELVHREPIENSPLWIIGNEEEGYFIALNDYRITDKAKTIEETRQKLHTEMWNILIRITIIMQEIIKRYDSKNTQEEERKEKVRQAMEDNRHQEN